MSFSYSNSPLLKLFLTSCLFSACSSTESPGREEPTPVGQGGEAHSFSPPPAQASGGSLGGGGAPPEGSGGTDSGGLPQVPDNGCNVRFQDKPLGFASMDAGTVGGGNLEPLLVTTEEQLKNYLEDSFPRVLHVMNDLDFRTENRPGVNVCRKRETCNNGSGKQIAEDRVSTNCDPHEYAATTSRYETRINVQSNKTVIGLGEGSGAAIRGASFNLGSSQQIIFRNLRIHDVNPHLIEAGDAFTLQGSRYVWLDHLRLHDISDGLVDLGSASHNARDRNITLSWIHFDGRTSYQCTGQHSYVNAVDNSEVTYHHNWFDHGSGRNPKIGQPNSRVHLFNNYWLNISYFCITAQTDSQARVESNYFENSSRPHWRQTDGNGTAGIAIDSGNIYTGVSSGSTSRDTGGTVFTAPYSYSKQTADEAKQAIVKCSGPQPIR